jgi:hypothetical protein
MGSQTCPRCDGSRKEPPRERPAPHPPDKRALGKASLLYGILSILVPLPFYFFGIVAIILALKQRRFFCEPLLMAGLITGIIGTVLWFVIALVIILNY